MTADITVPPWPTGNAEGVLNLDMRPKEERFCTVAA